MELLVSNGWTQLWLLIATGGLCIAVSLWLGAQHFRSRTKLTQAMARPSISNVYDEVPPVPTLHVTSVVQHGHIVEIKGATDAGAVVMINGQPVASVFPENTFKHFLGPLPAGTTIITVTCQDEKGGVNTQQLALTLE